MNLQMSFREWIDFRFPPEELILNASAVDGSDFHQAHPIGISVFALPWLPKDPKDFCDTATQDNLCSAMFQPGKKNRHRRARMWELLQKPWVAPNYCSVDSKRVSASLFMEQLRRDKFTCSPRGHGVDCHRNYEAILLKCIPLITGHDEALRWKYASLPVIFLDDYQNLDPQELEQIYKDFLDREFDFSCMTRSYWYARRPDVDIDRQSRRWLKKYKRWRDRGHYVTQPTNNPKKG